MPSSKGVGEVWFDIFGVIFIAVYNLNHFQVASSIATYTKI